MKDKNGDSSRSWRFAAGSTVAVLCGLAVAFLWVGRDVGDDVPLVLDPPATDTAATEAPSTEPPVAEPAATEPPVTQPPETEPPVTEPPVTEPPVTEPPETEPPSSTSVVAVGVADETGEDGDEATAGATTTVPSTPSTQPPGATPVAPADASYPTLEDGSPVPIVVIFDGETIAISGTAPSQAASDRLETLAIANSAVPNASVVNFLTINPDVPLGVGVRVIEMQSARFPESSAEIRPEHALQLTRAATIMNALPNISVVVIGHADQRGDPGRNYEISADRAQAVVDFIASQGVDPARMASRAVGESDLLTLNNDAVAFELNRRTEFIFYGLLVE